MSKITFAEDAWTEYLYWQSQDKKTLKKINNLLKAIQRDPFTGEGKPEPLKDSLNGEWTSDTFILKPNYIPIFYCLSSGKHNLTVTV